MSNPVKRKNSAYYYFLKAVPEDLVAIVGKTVIKKSLRTTDPVTAAVRNGELDILWTGNFATLRGGIITLNHEQRVAAAGVLYRNYVDLYRNEPGEDWQVAGRVLADAVTAGAPDTKVLVAGRQEITDRLLQHYKDRHRRTLSDFLMSEGLNLSPENFEATLAVVNKEMYRASLRILGFHRHDYSQDPADRYPPWKKPMPRGRDGQPIIPKKYDLLTIYDDYASQQGHAPKTIAKFRPILEQVAKEHPDVRTITREWCIEWKNQLLARGLSPRTVKNAYLSILNTVCAEAHGNLRIDVNPAASIRLSVREPILSRTVPGYSDREAAVVLTAAFGEMSDRLPDDQKRARRWLPWLCCYSGARIGELAQLRGRDVVKDAGFWFVELTPEAGPIKHRKPRRVPLHPHLMEQGFVEMAKRIGEGPLFSDPGRRRSTKPTLSKKTAENIGRWVRSLGVVDKELQPTHGWRHRFSTLCRGTSIAAEMANYIMGHVPVTAGQRYGGWRPEILGAAIQAFPYIDAASGSPRQGPGPDAPSFFPAPIGIYSAQDWRNDEHPASPAER